MASELTGNALEPRGRRLRLSGIDGRRLTRAAVTALPGAALIVFLCWPLLFTDSGMGQDWATHLWEMWRQSLAISNEHHPTLFLNFYESIFYPLYAFYGGTIYTLDGTLSVLLGNSPVTAYVIAWMAGFAAAFGGWCWLARMAGLGRWTAQLPGALFITSGYYLTLVYPRGDWAEFTVFSMIPLLLASGLCVLRAGRVEFWPALALVAATVVFCGGHNITMLYGLTLLALLGAVILVAVPAARTLFTRRGVARVALIAIPSALVNAWYLLPDVAYAARTSIANVYDYARELHALSYFVSAANLFTPFHPIEATHTPDFVYALPVVTIALVLVALALSLRFRGEGPWRRLLWIFSAFTLLVGILMTHPGLILDLPKPYPDIQFGLRLEAYVVFGLSAAVLAALMLARSWPRRWRLLPGVAVVVALIASGATAVQQVDGYPNGMNGPQWEVTPDRYVVFASNGQAPITATGLSCEPGIGCAFDDDTLPLVPQGEAEVIPQVEFPLGAVHDERVTLQVNEPPGTRIATNLSGAPYFVTIKGARAVGREFRGHVVLEVDGGTGQITISPANSLPVVLGRVVSLLAIAFLVLMFLWWLARRYELGPKSRRAA